jgi:hypothetical protein
MAPVREGEMSYSSFNTPETLNKRTELKLREYATHSFSPDAPIEKIEDNAERTVFRCYASGKCYEIVCFNDEEGKRCYYMEDATDSWDKKKIVEDVHSVYLRAIWISMREFLDKQRRVK